MFINSIELYGFVGIRDVFFFYNEAVKRSHCKKKHQLMWLNKKNTNFQKINFITLNFLKNI